MSDRWDFHCERGVAGLIYVRCDQIPALLATGYTIKGALIDAANGIDTLDRVARALSDQQGESK